MQNNSKTFRFIYIALIAVIGIVLKPIVGPLAKSIAATFFIPTGTIAGAIYMIWPLLALLVIRRLGTATSVGLIEGVIVMITGLFGSHGVLSIIIYTVPCILIDIGFLPFLIWQNRFLLFLPTALGNAAGSLLVGQLIMNIPPVPLIISSALSFIFGGIAGFLAYSLFRFLSTAFPDFETLKQRKY